MIDIETENSANRADLMPQIEKKVINQEEAQNNLKIKGERAIKWLSTKSRSEVEIALRSLIMKMIAKILEGLQPS